MVRIGIVGTGGMGLSRARRVLSSNEAELAWICSRSADRAREMLEKADPDGERSETVTCIDDWESGFRDPTVDAIILCTPNTLHHKLAIEAIRSDKDLCVEYPHVTVPAQGRDLIAAAGKSGRAFHVGLTHRYGAAHAAFAALCNGDGKHDMGKPLVYQLAVCSGNPISRWYDKDGLSGGMFVSSLYHFIDEALAFFGEYTDYLPTYWRDLIDRVTRRDCAGITIRFAKGCTAQLSYARGLVKPGLGSRRVIIFERGYVISEGGATRILTPTGTESLEVADVDSIGIDTDTFIDLVRSDGGVDETADQAQRTLELASAAQDTAIEVGPSV